jgi:hypothetical protein
LENRALNYAVHHVSSKDIEQSIAADADAMERGGQLLTAAGRRDPSGAEIDATAQLIGEGVDSATIAQLVKASPANRPLEVPLRIGAELVALNTVPNEALLRVAEKVNSGASDAQLEHLLDERPTVVATQSKGKKKESSVAKTGSTTDVRQAGTPVKSHSTTKAHKTSSK